MAFSVVCFLNSWCVTTIQVKDKDKSVVDLEQQLVAEKKARLAAQASLKEKASQLEKAEKALSGKDVRGAPVDRRPLLEKTQEAENGSLTTKGGGVERRFFQEKAQEAGTDGPLTKQGGAGALASSMMSPVIEAENQSENLDPQHGGETAYNIKAKVLPTRYYSPTIRRKLSRIPMRASIASTYQINPASLRESYSSEESAADASKDNNNSRYSTDILRRDRRISNFSRPAPPMVPTASALFGRKKVVHFASPVFQKEKTRGEPKTFRGDGGGDPQSNPRQSIVGLSQGDATESKKLAAAKIRRVSLARRASGQFTQRTAGGAQRVLNTGPVERKAGVLPPLQPLPKERRWNK